MKKYEYKILEAQHSKHAQQIMDEMSKEGWRVISTTLWKNFEVLLMITFEREIIN